MRGRSRYDGFGLSMKMDTTISDLHSMSDEGNLVVQLLIMSPGSFATVPLPVEGTLQIGRSPSSDVHLADPMASRQHARLQVGEHFSVEDLRSANGTKLKDQSIKPGQPVVFRPGEAIVIGSTVLMVQHGRSSLGKHRLWSHAYFESRLEAECARGEGMQTRFVLIRFQVLQPVSRSCSPFPGPGSFRCSPV